MYANANLPHPPMTSIPCRTKAVGFLLRTLATHPLHGLIGCLALAGFCGCAFDVSHVKLVPANYTAVTPPGEAFVLTHETKVSLGTGFPTRLKAGTRWTQTGTIESGKVFTTKDQIVTVEASNIFEAQLVVANGCVTGFYLPVEKKSSAANRPLPIQTQPLKTQQP